MKSNYYLATNLEYIKLGYAIADYPIRQETSGSHQT